MSTAGAAGRDGLRAAGGVVSGGPGGVPDAVAALVQGVLDDHPGAERAAYGRLIVEAMRRDGWVVAVVGRRPGAAVDGPSDAGRPLKSVDGLDPPPGSVSPARPPQAAGTPLQPREEAFMDHTRTANLTIGLREAEKASGGPVAARTPARSSASPAGPAAEPPGAVSGPPVLAPPDRELIGHLIAGLDAGQIARRMNVSGNAYRNRLFRLRQRLGAATTPQLIHRAYELGLLPLHAPVPPLPVARVSTGGPRSGLADARLIAARLEASLQGRGAAR